MKNERKANCKVQTIFDEVYFTPTVLDLSFTALKILFYHVSGTSTLDDFLHSFTRSRVFKYKQHF